MASIMMNAIAKPFLIRDSGGSSSHARSVTGIVNVRYLVAKKKTKQRKYQSLTTFRTGDEISRCTVKLNLNKPAFVRTKKHQKISLP